MKCKPWIRHFQPRKFHSVSVHSLHFMVCPPLIHVWSLFYRTWSSTIGSTSLRCEPRVLWSAGLAHPNEGCMSPLWFKVGTNMQATNVCDPPRRATEVPRPSTLSLKKSPSASKARPPSLGKVSDKSERTGKSLDKWRPQVTFFSRFSEDFWPRGPERLLELVRG